MSNMSTLIANDIPGPAGCDIGRKPKGRDQVADGPMAVPVFWLALFDDRHFTTFELEHDEGDTQPTCTLRSAGSYQRTRRTSIACCPWPGSRVTTGRRGRFPPWVPRSREPSTCAGTRTMPVTGTTRPTCSLESEAGHGGSQLPTRDGAKGGRAGDRGVAKNRAIIVILTKDAGQPPRGLAAISSQKFGRR